MISTMRNQACFYINGQKVHANADECQMMLADFLRYKKSLTGTKIVCAEGDCGACTVLKRSPISEAMFTPINSCIANVAQMDGASLVTVEGLTTEKTSLPHPAQSAMVKCHGSQCGFCTPGFVMAIAGEMEAQIKTKSKAPFSTQQAKNALTGNLCRCTGYQPIIDAVVSIQPNSTPSLDTSYYSKAVITDLKKIIKTPLIVKTDTFTYYSPTTLNDAKKYIAKNKHAKIIAGTTDLGVLHNKQKQKINGALSLRLIPELYKISKTATTVKIGSQVNLASLRKFVQTSIPELATFLDIFASPQIKNVATLAGNIANASPIADTPPFLLIMNAKIEVVNSKRKLLIPIEDFYLSYKKTKLSKDDIITYIYFDLPSKKDILKLYKVSQRKDLDISAVNLAVRMQAKNNKVQSIKVAAGGVAAIPVRLYTAESFLIGKEITTDTIRIFLSKIRSEITPLSDIRASDDFRHLLVENLMYKFFREHNFIEQKKWDLQL